MEWRPLEITVVSAKGLKKVKDVPAMNVYLEATISGDPRTMQRTPVAKDGGNNPTWNFPMQFMVDEGRVCKKGLALILKLRCPLGPAAGDKDLGEAQVSLKDLFEKSGKGNSPKKESCPVKKPSGKEKGEVKFTFKFGEKVLSAPTPGAPTMPQLIPIAPPTAYPYGAPNNPYMAPLTPYPAPPVAAPLPAATRDFYAPLVPQGYPQAPYCQPQPMGYGYAPPPAPQGPYGYAPPPAQAGYGYAPQPQQQGNNNDNGYGMAAAFAVGAVGGMLISDAASNQGSAYEAGYDAGYANGSGF